MNSLQIEDQWLQLERSEKPLRSIIESDSITEEACRMFDYSNEYADFYPWKIPELPKTWGIGLIVGASGSGKSVLLNEFGTIKEPEWNNKKSVLSHFDNAKSATSVMYAVGLSSVPTWTKPYKTLSNGEKFRVNLARQLHNNALIDEFTSVVDRNVAKSASKTIKNYVVDNKLTNLVFASCHRDIIEWLQPDWIIDTDAGMYCLLPKECLRRKPMVVEIYEVNRTMWNYYMGHHYLTTSLHPFARCYVASMEGQAISFGAAIPFPNGHIKKAWRGHRTVTKPDYQGLGIGVRLSDWIAEAHIKGGYRYFSRTTHPRMGMYRELSKEWRATSGNLKPQKSNPNPNWSHWNFDDKRIAYSHEFIGE
jgi:GNAT superfamily N-acetyltransferase